MGIDSLKVSDPQGPIGGRPSGIPRPGKMGASRNEFRSLLVAVLLLLLIGVAFWFESTH